jgi:protein-S-isoprenylcysteine O-methyltransferase Ste14
MTFTADHAITIPWLLLAAFWAITAVSAKKSLRSESTPSQLYHVLFMTGVFALLFRRDIRIGQLGVHVLPASAQVAYAGLVLTSLGATFAIWARSTLGRNWSGTVTVKENHSFVYHGPYRLVRHPIYAGGLLAMLGTAIVYGEAGCFLAVALAFVGWWLKTRREEEFMTQQFGEEYRRYQRNVKRLIPFVL